MIGRKAAIGFSLVLALTAGCGDGGGETSSTSSTTLPPLECPDPIAIASTEDLVAVLAGIPWESQGAYTSGPLPITPDLVISGTVVLEAADLPIPQNCLNRADCSPQGGFFVSSPVPGTALEGDAGLACDDSFARLSLDDTTVRLRPYLRDTHPCRFNYVPVVAVLPACGSPCTEGKALCPGDGTCYAIGATFCRLCSGGSKEACACQGEAGPLAEGASCLYWQSGDVQCVGTCRQGACESGDALCR